LLEAFWAQSGGRLGWKITSPTIKSSYPFGKIRLPTLPLSTSIMGPQDPLWDFEKLAYGVSLYIPPRTLIFFARAIAPDCSTKLSYLVCMAVRCSDILNEIHPPVPSPVSTSTNSPVRKQPYERNPPTRLDANASPRTWGSSCQRLPKD